MPQAAVQSSVSYLLASRLFWGVRESFNVGRSVVFVPVKTSVCSKRCVIRKLTLLFFPSLSEEKVKFLFY